MLFRSVRKGTEQLIDSTGAQRSFQVAEHNPGFWVEELQHGEKLHTFQSGAADEQFGVFEEAITSGIGWALEIPPEILRLSFSSNYSASQAAVNEFKMYLNRVRFEFGTEFCKPIYTEWLLSEVLNGKVQAPGLLQAWRDPRKQDEHAAWVSSDWTGNIKPAVKLSELVKAYAEMVDRGWITNDRAARELSGTKFSKNVKRALIEAQQLLKVKEITREFESAPTPEPAPSEPTGDDEDDDERGALHVVDSRRQSARSRASL